MNLRAITTTGLLSLMVLTAASPAAATYIGGSLTKPPNADIDGVPPLVILGQWEATDTVTSSTTMPIPFTGVIDQVDFYGDGYDFTVYTLKLVGNVGGNLTFQVDGSENFDGSSTYVGVQYLAADIPATAG